MSALPERFASIARVILCVNGCSGPLAYRNAAPGLSHDQVAVVDWAEAKAGWGTGVKNVMIGDYCSYALECLVPAGDYEILISIAGTGPRPSYHGASPTAWFNVKLKGGHRYEARCDQSPQLAAESDTLCWLVDSQSGQAIGDFKGYVMSWYDEWEFDGVQSTKRSRPLQLEQGVAKWPPPANP